MSKQKTLPAHQAVNFRKAVIPKPPIIAACRNCKHFTYDTDDRYGSRGILLMEKTRKRCPLNGFSVTSNSVCDKHEFKYEDQRDI